METTLSFMEQWKTELGLFRLNEINVHFEALSDICQVTYPYANPYAQAYQKPTQRPPEENTQITGFKNLSLAL